MGWFYDFAKRVANRRGKKINVKTEATPGSQRLMRVRCNVDFDVSVPSEFEETDMEEPFSAAVDMHGLTLELPYYMKIEESFLSSIEVTSY